MQTALGSLEKVWAEHNIILPSFTWLPDNEYGTTNGTLTGQRSNMPDEFFEFFRSLYADDRVLHVRFKRGYDHMHNPNSHPSPAFRNAYACGIM